MRNLNLKKVALGSVLSFSFSSLHAGIAQCPQDIVHCAYITGISDKLDDGRFLKLENKYVGSLVICFNGTGTMFIDQEGAGNYLGANHDLYSICTDASGTNCQHVGMDSFDISAGNDGFVAKPQYYNINLTPFKNKYPACNSSDS